MIFLQVLFVVSQPDVYRSPNSNTWMYVTAYATNVKVNEVTNAPFQHLR